MSSDADNEFSWAASRVLHLNSQSPSCCHSERSEARPAPRGCWAKPGRRSPRAAKTLRGRGFPYRSAKTHRSTQGDRLPRGLMALQQPFMVAASFDKSCTSSIIRAETALSLLRGPIHCLPFWSRRLVPSGAVDLGAETARRSVWTLVEVYAGSVSSQALPEKVLGLGFRPSVEPGVITNGS
jgi:hypothetical protein